jgi:hypothetical protein
LAQRIFTSKNKEEKLLNLFTKLNKNTVDKNLVDIIDNFLSDDD